MSKFKHKTELHCMYCSAVVFSRWSGEFVGHECAVPGTISEKYDHDKKRAVPAFPYFAIDETEHYCRIIGANKHFKVVYVGDSGK